MEGILNMLAAMREMDKITRENPNILRALELISEQKGIAIPMQVDQLLTKSEVQKALKTCPATVDSLTKSGKLVCVTTPGSMVKKYPASEVNRLIRELPKAN